MTTGRDQLRASDADRQAVADRVRTALDEGRLTLVEFDERLRQAYAARTYQDLDVVVADLPPGPVAAAPTITLGTHAVPVGNTVPVGSAVPGASTTPAAAAGHGPGYGAGYGPPEVPRRSTLDGTHRSMRARGLVRPADGRVLGGVCAGLGRRLDMSPWLARLLFVLAVLFLPGPLLLAYPILWIVMPPETRPMAGLPGPPGFPPASPPAFPTAGPSTLPLAGPPVPPVYPAAGRSEPPIPPAGPR